MIDTLEVVQIWGGDASRLEIGFIARRSRLIYGGLWLDGGWEPFGRSLWPFGPGNRACFFVSGYGVGMFVSCFNLFRRMSDLKLQKYACTNKTGNFPGLCGDFIHAIVIFSLALAPLRCYNTHALRMPELMFIPCGQLSFVLKSS